MARERRNAIVAVLVGVMLSLATVAAQEKATQPSSEMPYPLPKPGAEMKKLDFLLGDWKVAETHEAGPGFAGGPGQGKTSSQLGPGGLSIVTDYDSTGPVGRYIGKIVITWEAADNLYRIFWFDNLQVGSMILAGKWEGNDLVLAGEVKIMGQILKTKQIYTDITPRSHTFKMYVDDGKQQNLVVTIKATKK